MRYDESREKTSSCQRTVSACAAVRCCRLRVDAHTKTCGTSDDQGHGNHTKGNKDWFWCLLRPRCSPHQPSETALSEIGLKCLTIGAAKGSKLFMMPVRGKFHKLLILQTFTVCFYEFELASGYFFFLDNKTSFFLFPLCKEIFMKLEKQSKNAIRNRLAFEF